MTNEDKANELSKRGFNDLNNPYTRIIINHAKDCCLEMVQWKCEQFKQTVKDYIFLAYSNGQEANLLEYLLKELQQ